LLHCETSEHPDQFHLVLYFLVFVGLASPITSFGPVLASRPSSCHCLSSILVKKIMHSPSSIEHARLVTLRGAKNNRLSTSPPIHHQTSSKLWCSFVKVFYRMPLCTVVVIKMRNVDADSHLYHVLYRLHFVCCTTREFV
jgi:hypothetical protein